MLNLGHATVNDEFDAGDVATFVGRKKRDRPGTFLHSSCATQGISPAELSVYCLTCSSVMPSSEFRVGVAVG